MSGGISNRLLIFAAAISAGYLLMEVSKGFFGAISKAAKPPSASDESAASTSSYAVEHMVMQRPKPPQLPTLPPGKNFQMDPEDFLETQREQVQAMRDKLRADPNSTNRDDGMTQESIDAMEREGRINI